MWTQSVQQGQPGISATGGSRGTKGGGINQILTWAHLRLRSLNELRGKLCKYNLTERNLLRNTFIWLWSLTALGILRQTLWVWSYFNSASTFSSLEKVSFDIQCIFLTTRFILYCYFPINISLVFYPKRQKNIEVTLFKYNPNLKSKGMSTCAFTMICQIILKMYFKLPTYRFSLKNEIVWVYKLKINPC
jgi:hypothetical protein